MKINNKILVEQFNWDFYPRQSSADPAIYKLEDNFKLYLHKRQLYLIYADEKNPIGNGIKVFFKDYSLFDKNDNEIKMLYANEVINEPFNDINNTSFYLNGELKSISIEEYKNIENNYFKK